MRVLGIVLSSTEVRWAILGGRSSAPKLVTESGQMQKLPADESEGHALLALRRWFATFLNEVDVDRISILKAGRSQKGNTSSSRIKAEGVIQLAAAEEGVSADLVAPQTLRAKEKKFEAIVGARPEEALNGGAPFKPSKWRDAVLVAWVGLDS